jgi:DNA-binding PadR family transcriptional regulator
MSSLSHSFTVRVAKAVGERKAVILTNFGYWHGKNSVDVQHVHDGHVWLYNSITGFAKVWEYLSEKEIRTALDGLEKDGYLKTGNYNKFQQDRTKWYALTEKACELLEIEFMPKISHLPKRANGFPKRANDLSKESNEICPDSQMSFDPEGKPLPLINPLENPLEKQLQPDSEKSDVVDEEFERVKGKINEVRALVKKAIQFRNNVCMPLRLKPEYYNVLLDAFFDEQIGFAQAKQVIRIDSLQVHFKNWLTIQVELGNRCRYHKNFTPIDPVRSAPVKNGSPVTPFTPQNYYTNELT